MADGPLSSNSAANAAFLKREIGGQKRRAMTRTELEPSGSHQVTGAGNRSYDLATNLVPRQPIGETQPNKLALRTKSISAVERTASYRIYRDRP